MSSANTVLLAVLFLLLILLTTPAAAQEQKRRFRTFGLPPWAKQSWFMRRQVEQPIALRGGNLIDVQTGAVRENVTIVITGDIIAAVFSGDGLGHGDRPDASEAPTSDAKKTDSDSARIETIPVDPNHPLAAGKVPDNARTIDITGQYVIPGLFDLHAHVIPKSIFFPDAKGPEDTLKTLIEHGVTTIRALPFHSESAAEWAGRVATGELLGPTIVTTSCIFEKEPQRTSMGFGDAATAAAWVHKEALLGSRWIKVYNSMDEDAFRAIVAAAERHGMRICGHTEDVPPLRASELGIGSIEHVISFPLSCLRDGTKPDEDMDLGETTAWRWANIDDDKLAALLKTMRDNETAWVPTLVVSEQMMLEGAHDGEEFSGADKAGLEAALRKAAQTVVRFHREGGLVGLGTDFPVDGVKPGVSVHRELQLLVEYGGATPAEALQIATLGSARVLGHEQIVGTVAPGKLAHLVILRDNPLEDIAHTREITYVIHDGRVRVEP